MEDRPREGEEGKIGDRERVERVYGGRTEQGRENDGGLRGMEKRMMEEGGVERV
jgi:hypothetical protein